MVHAALKNVVVKAMLKCTRLFLFIDFPIVRRFHHEMELFTESIRHNCTLDFLRVHHLNIFCIIQNLSFQGCKESLELWYREHYVVFLGVGLVVVLIEFMVLLSTILTCTRIYHYNQEAKDNAKNSKQEPEFSTPKEVSFQKRPSSSQAGAYSNETYAAGSFRQNYNLVDRA